MPSTTEICNLELVAGSDIGDPNNRASQVLKECGDTLAQQDGMQQVQFGMQVENPATMQMFINWDSKPHHETFQSSDAYKPFLNRFSTIFTGSPSIVHADLRPEGGLAAALSAPVTEVATFYFNTSPPEDAHAGVAKCLENVEKETGEKLYGWAYGFTHEEIEREGVKGKGAVLVIGWDSVETHMKVRGTEAFKSNVGLLRNGAEGIEMHHTRFMNFVAD